MIHTNKPGISFQLKMSSINGKISIIVNDTRFARNFQSGFTPNAIETMLSGKGVPLFLSMDVLKGFDYDFIKFIHDKKRMSYLMAQAFEGGFKIDSIVINDMENTLRVQAKLAKKAKLLETSSIA